MQLEQKIIELREKNGWNQKELAKKSGLSPATISRIEKGKIKKPSKYIKPLAKALKIDETEFLKYLQKDILSKSKTIKIGYAFSIWSAPFAYYQIKKRNSVKDIELTSFGFKSEDGHIPLFYSAENKPDDFNFFTQNQRGLITYNARYLFELLNQGELDCVVIAGKLIQNKLSYIQIAKIMNTAFGSCELLISTFDQEIDTASSEKKNWLEDWINDIYEEEANFFSTYLIKNSEIDLNNFYKKLLFEEIESQTKVETDPILLNILEEQIRQAKNIHLNFNFKRFISSLREAYKDKYINVLNRFTHKLFKIQLFYNEPTIAKEHYEKFIELTHFSQINTNHICIAESIVWKKEIEEAIFPFIISKNNQVFTDYKRTILFLCWQPKIEHFKYVIRQSSISLVNKTPNLRTLNLHQQYSQNSESEEIYFTFDLIAKSRFNKSAIYQPTFLIFLKELRDCIYEIKDALNQLLQIEFDLAKEKNRVYLENQNLQHEIKNINKELKNSAPIGNIKILLENQIKYYKSRMEKNNIRLNINKEKFETHINDNEVIKTIANVFDISPKSCFESIKSLHFDLECNFEWVLNLIEEQR